MTIDEVLAFYKLRYAYELADMLKQKHGTVYRWTCQGIPLKFQKKFSEESNGKLKVKFKPRKPRKPRSKKSDLV